MRLKDRAAFDTARCAAYNKGMDRLIFQHRYGLSDEAMLDLEQEVSEIKTNVRQLEDRARWLEDQNRCLWETRKQMDTLFIELLWQITRYLPRPLGPSRRKYALHDLYQKPDIIQGRRKELIKAMYEAAEFVDWTDL
jgi:hypothetical protein